MLIRRFVILTLVLCMLVSTASLANTQILLENPNTGPFVDNLLYKVISGSDQEILAILNKDIDIIGSPIEPQYLAVLEADPDIETAGVLENGYGQLVINTAKYPFNITAFRRALAFALDKNAISAEALSGAAYPIDSPIPQVNPWTTEGSLSYSYYDSQASYGNQLLDNAGFVDIDADGWREAPDNSDFDVTIEVASTSTTAIAVGEKVAAALQLLHVDATVSPTDFNSLISKVNLHGNFDMVHYGKSFSGLGARWLETYYGGSYSDVDFCNPSNFENATFDAWLPQLLHGNTYGDVYEAASELQKILIYECPIIILYEQINFAAYRTDVFENHVMDSLENIPSFWTNMKVQKKASLGGPFGGVLRISTIQDVDSFNFMIPGIAATNNILKNTRLSLLKRDETGLFVPWLAESWIIETHAMNPSVPVGHTRLTFNLLQNATWSDGHPVDGSDVAFSFNYYYDSMSYGNPIGIDLQDFYTAYSPTPNQVAIEFNIESYWHLDSIATLDVIPEHIFEVIGTSGWDTWNPILSADPFVTASPFNVSNYVSGEFIELTYCDEFFYAPIHVTDIENPVVTGPILVTFAEGETGYDISWNLADEHPASYEIYKDGSLYEYGPWDETSGNITISLDGLSAGISYFTLYAYDESGNSGSWSVMVMVLDIIPPVLNHPPDFEFRNGTTGNFVSWTGTDNNPLSYVILVNETEASGGYWNSSTEILQMNVDYLSPGIYNVTIYAFDVSANYDSDTVWVTVLEPETNPIMEFLLDNILLIAGIGAGLMLVVVFIIIRARQ